MISGLHLGLGGSREGHLLSQLPSPWKCSLICVTTAKFLKVTYCYPGMIQTQAVHKSVVDLDLPQEVALISIQR